MLHCEEVQAKLPLVVNGTFQGPEFIRVMQHVQICADCMQDLVLWTSLKSGMTAVVDSNVAADLLDNTWQTVLTQVRNLVTSEQPHVTSEQSRVPSLRHSGNFTPAPSLGVTESFLEASATIASAVRTSMEPFLATNQAVKKAAESLRESLGNALRTTLSVTLLGIAVAAQSAEP